jgi:hypothetical protein
VGADLDDPAAVENDDEISRPGGGEAVRDEDGNAALEAAQQSRAAGVRVSPTPSRGRSRPGPGRLASFLLAAGLDPARSGDECPNGVIAVRQTATQLKAAPASALVRG